ncbi:chorismate mutase [Candidatus Gottesmanbacteria bacterium]|nr:chorismate mutase [Candidatus Gottesmanbacteria bacterium]
MRLDSIRNKIDLIDNKLLQLLTKRLLLVKQLSFVKHGNLLPIEDKSREKKILQRLKAKARTLNLSRDFVTKVFRQILEESKNIQKNTL